MLHGATIPKRIHYCWLSGEPFNQLALECMETWKRVLPDYEIVRWDMNSFDVDSVEFAREACSVRKWAFASDYIRLFSVYTQGGLYFDTDVRVMRSLDAYLESPMFIPVEYHPGIADTEEARGKLDGNGHLRDRNGYADGIGLQAAIFGATKGHPFLRECMAFYESKRFINPDGSYHMDPIAPGIYAKAAEQHGFVYRDRPQELNNGVSVIESKYFPSHPSLATDDAAAIHWCSGSWRDKAPLGQRIVNRIRRAVGR